MNKSFFVSFLGLFFVLACSSRNENRVVVKKVKVSSGLKGEAKPARAKKTGMPRDHVHMGMGAMGTPVATDGGNPPLKKMGIGSAKELEEHVAACSRDDLKAKEALEKAFRLAFTTDRSKRDLKQASTLFRMVLGSHPECALAHRGLAYIAILDGFRVADAISEYKAAINADPNYGEALYGLATLMLNTDAQAGLPYFQRAMKLGIPDEHGLKAMYNKIGK